MRVRNISSLVWIALVCFLVIVMSVKGQMATAEDDPSNYVIQFEGKVARDDEVYLKDGRIYVSFKFLTHALGLNVNISLIQEEHVYHNYETQHNNKTVRVWGNDEHGYQLQTRPLVQKGRPYNTEMSEPTFISKPKSDNCRWAQSKCYSPFVNKGTLYVPLREIAMVFDLNVNIQHTDKLTVVDLQSMVK
ncbi:hypothetical protein [Paenibacillus taiwanensis]|uniref:hypothetical protein n=1 Tax=Paenibacillus taiwanensis TaxID=401638 RepID=UPI000491213A|nr:hypothetical protein [Paenibacillus taiwanensis]